MYQDQNIIDRLLRSRKIDGDCWLWTGCKTHNGYGQVALSNGKRYRVHRLSYEVFVGEPKDLILHRSTCKSRACFNPKHLYDGTHEDNLKDAISAGTHKIWGH